MDRDSVYDPSIAYCVEGDHKLATHERISGIVMDGDDFTEVVDLVCAEHAVIA